MTDAMCASKIEFRVDRTQVSLSKISPDQLVSGQLTLRIEFASSIKSRQIVLVIAPKPVKASLLRDTYVRSAKIGRGIQ
jgi:hypothetical protein